MFRRCGVLFGVAVLCAGVGLRWCEARCNFYSSSSVFEDESDTESPITRRFSEEAEEGREEGLRREEASVEGDKGDKAAALGAVGRRVMTCSEAAEEED
eukprot:CAMPEP_0173173776 /NCGR_PEP_ID=MMETSP1141-20130122/3007_1 /TAXON_ID=483371 /ORGANISM="non described non described, Strain CCMP2298" /LENGTH=98 /DNA_ID=CAMNT_0014095871 /DNA_START=301 /DNA_END=597 /DNA_ORIENTATION=+